MANELRDYYASATVRANGRHPWHLWARRVQAVNLSDARSIVLREFINEGYDFGELQILWADAPALMPAGEEVQS